MLGLCAALFLISPVVRWAWRTMLPLLPEGTLHDTLQDPVVTVRRLALFDPDEFEDQFGKSDPLGGEEFHGTQPTEEELQAALAGAAAFVGVVTISFIAQVVFVCVYKRKITDQRPAWPQEGSQQYTNSGNDFSVTPWSCFDDIHTCLHVTCCPMARYADTMQATGVMAFWMVLVVLFVAYVVASVLGSLLEKVTGSKMDLVADLVVVVAMVYFRQNLREKLSGGTKPAFEDKGKLLEDCVLWTCCGCCAAIQEARQVDQATGLQVECCLKIKAASQPMGVVQGTVQGNSVVTGVPLVGSAVAVQN